MNTPRPAAGPGCPDGTALAFGALTPEAARRLGVEPRAVAFVPDNDAQAGVRFALAVYTLDGTKLGGNIDIGPKGIIPDADGKQ